MAAKPTVRFRRIRSRNFSPGLRCESPRSSCFTKRRRGKTRVVPESGERGKRRRRRGARRNEERSGTGRNGRETVRSRALSAEREGDGGETERERRALQRRGYASLRNYASFSGPYNCVIQTLLFPIRYILGSPSRFATLLSPFSFLLLRFLSLGPSLGPLFVYHSDEEDVGGPEISGDAQRADAHRSHSRCPLLGIGRLGLSG